MFKSPLLIFALTASLVGCANQTGNNAAVIAFAGQGVTVFAAGDIADCRFAAASDSRAARTADLIKTGIAKDPTTTVLTLGDHTYPIGLPAEFSGCYEPTWGQFKDRTYPSAGNHEYYSPEGFGYFQYFGQAAGTPQRSYYSINKGAWHIVSLNSNLKKEQQQQQMDWLADDLKNNKSACTLAYWHHPVYSSGPHGNNAQMKQAWQLLMAAKADVVLSGHDHHYERFALQDGDGQIDDKAGIRQFVIGTGGAKLSPVFWRKPHSEALNNDIYGVLKLNLKAQGYEWEFLPVQDTAKVAFTDQGSTACHAKG